MRRALFLPALATLALATPASAAGLVQLTLEGRIQSHGGAWVEFVVDYWDGEVVRTDTLGMHLARGTGAHDLAVLLGERWTLGGARVLVPSPAAGENDVPAHLFLHGAERIELALGNGLTGIVTACDVAPVAVRLQPPYQHVAPCDLIVSATTRHDHTGARDQASFQLTLEPELNSAQISDRLFKDSLEAKWIGERPGTDAWRPVKMADGARILGVSVGVRSAGDWRLEVRLGNRR